MVGAGSPGTCSGAASLETKDVGAESEGGQSGLGICIPSTQPGLSVPFEEGSCETFS